jgi:hypothetical protein
VLPTAASGTGQARALVVAVPDTPTIAAMPSDELATRIRTASRSCSAAVSGHVFRPPAEVFKDLARACAELGIEDWDLYGESGPVERLEQEVMAIFGVPAVAFFPSGVMAQQTALRIHADRAGVRRVAMPDLSHLLVHEEDGPRILHDLEICLLTRNFETPASRHVEAIPGRLGAVLVELPGSIAPCRKSRRWPTRSTSPSTRGLAGSRGRPCSVPRISSRRPGCGAGAWAARFSVRRRKPSPR